MGKGRVKFIENIDVEFISYDYDISRNSFQKNWIPFNKKSYKFMKVPYSLILTGKR